MTKPLRNLIELEKNARAYGFEWPDPFMILDQVIDECREIREDIAYQAGSPKVQEEVGDLLHAVLSLCFHLGYDVEETIEGIHVKFSRRMSLLKDLVKKRGLKNLRGQSIDSALLIWKEVKRIEAIQALVSQPTLKINCLIASDIPVLVAAFHEAPWEKPKSLFESYLKDQETGKRCVWVAYDEIDCVGYVTLLWDSGYKHFTAKNIPEIVDLNVLSSYRKKGIGSRLLSIAEKEAKKRGDIIGIGVGLYSGPDGGYGAAQKLYIARGYVPDGNGVTYKHASCAVGEKYPVDDDLVLWLTKRL